MPNPHNGRLSVSEDVEAGENYSIFGVNFPSSTIIKLSACTPGCASAHNVPSDSDGEFEAVFTAGRSGVYSFTAFVSEEKGNSGKFRLKVHDSIEFFVGA